MHCSGVSVFCNRHPFTMATLQQMAGALVLRNDGNGTSAEEEEEKGGNETIADRIRKRRRRA